MVKVEDFYLLNEEEIVEMVIEDCSMGWDVFGYVVFISLCYMIVFCVVVFGILIVMLEVLFFIVDEENLEY